MQKVCSFWNKSRGLLVTRREGRNHCKKQPLTTLSSFPFPFYPSSQSSILIILSEQSAHSKGRKSQRKEVLVAPLKGKSCRPCPGQRSASDPAEKKPRTGSCIQGTVVCSEEGNKGPCISAPLKRQPKQSSSFSLPTVRTNYYQLGRERAPPPGQIQV